MRIRFHENNSGGYFRLTQADYDALAADGWVGEGVLENRYGGREMFLDLPAVTDEREGCTIAGIEFTRVTGKDYRDPGCNCCGFPYQFEEAWEDDEDE